jgi:hypothetical protein
MLERQDVMESLCVESQPTKTVLAQTCMGVFFIRSDKFFTKLHILYSFPNIIRQIKENEVGGTCGTHGR